MNNFLYHYTGALALKNIIQTNSFWITKSEYLNDATEQGVIKSLLNSFFKSHPNMERGVQDFISDSLEKYLNDYNYYILSFSESDDSLPLWNYYSENEGYNIGIEREGMLALMEMYFKGFDEDNQVIITGVQYVDEVNRNKSDKINQRINDLLLPFTLLTIEDLNNTLKKEKVMEAMLELANISFSLKNSAYSSEKEERIVVITKKNSSLTSHEEFRVFRGAFIPYIVFNKENNPKYVLPIKKVTLSPYQTLDMSQSSLLYMLNHNGYKEIIIDDIKISKIPSRY